MHVVEDAPLLLYVGMLDELGKVLLFDAYVEGTQFTDKIPVPYTAVHISPLKHLYRMLPRMEAEKESQAQWKEKRPVL